MAPASSSSDRAVERQVHAEERTSPEIIEPSARRHSDMKRNELQSASKKPTVSHPLLVEERAQRSTSPAMGDSAGITSRSTLPMDVLIPTGSQRLTSAMAMPT